ncbi:hypothetical protein [Caballeronia sp. LZ034LL]|uniref:hypothetical protein n=1 Tax=Caballeronia sp. LZ034LL TaxID=3038567 RepID=UPI00286066C6|nr:hypothetical protein [Caballeronia sp. LZ034LL]MDR5836614.1 hypothetical protein [Caballeronia sp. LZ034LL]
MLKHAFHPLHWYDYIVYPAYEVMLAYLAKIEEQVDAGVADFRRNKRLEVLEETDEYNITVEHHEGFVHGFWDLHVLFERDFPSIQRRSALITLYSFLEHELDKLCELLQRTEDHALSLKEIHGTGIDRSAIFLKKVAGLAIPRNNRHWAEIRNIQKTRNAFVHANGRIEQESRLLPYVKASQHLAMYGSEITIQNGYLDHVLDVFKKHFLDVHAALQLKYS